MARTYDKFPELGVDVGAAVYGDPVMLLCLHRVDLADRADLLVNGLSGMLRESLIEPFPEELGLGPTSGIERWPGQQLIERSAEHTRREKGWALGERVDRKPDP